MPTPAVIPRSPFVPRTGQPPYSHVGNSTRAKLDGLGLTALRAKVDVEPYGSSDLGGDPSDDEPPSMTSASPSEDNDPEDPENPSGRKKRMKRKTRCPEGRRSQEAEAIATSKIVVNLPEFGGKDLSEFAENFGRFLRMTGRTHATGRVKCDLLLQCCKTKLFAVRQPLKTPAYVFHYSSFIPPSSGHKLYVVFHNKSSCQVPRNLKSLGNFRGLGAFLLVFCVNQ